MHSKHTWIFKWFQLETYSIKVIVDSYRC
jgi:hypothetical protein